MNLYRILITSVLLPLLLSLQDASGTISGRVLTRDGLPAANFEVQFRGLYPPATLRKFTITDAEGYYTASDLGIGEYAIYTDSNSEWFPMRGGSFMQAEPDARAVVGPGATVTRDLTLPPPAAYLQGILLDAQDHRLPNHKVVLCHADGPDGAERSVDLLSDREGVFTSYVPSNESLSALAVDPSGKAIQITGITLQPEQKKSITLHFEPLTSIDGTRCIPVVKD